MPETPERNVYTVTRLNREVRLLLERGLTVIWLEAELSNFTQPASGHWYFTLKDPEAQIRGAMFRQRNMNLGFTPKSGQLVLVRGRVSLYEPRGDYQMIVEHMEEAGVGALKREFERLKARLAAEGLFAPELKRPLPAFPRRIGVITSAQRRRMRDVLHILKRRYPPARVLIYPTPVQGAAAVPALIAALQLASMRAECEVLILARGGGSIEDLWAFNDEGVARAIRACAHPGGERGRPRNRFHDRRFCRRCARANSLGRRRAGGPRPPGTARHPQRIGDACCNRVDANCAPRPSCWPTCATACNAPTRECACSTAPSAWMSWSNDCEWRCRGACSSSTSV